MLVLETETPPLELCAAALLRVNPQIYRRRMATLRIIVDKKWQGQGLGKALAAAATDLADNELMIERVEVEIPTTTSARSSSANPRASASRASRATGCARLDGKYVDATSWPTAAKRSNAPRKQKNRGAERLPFFRAFCAGS